MTRNDVKITVLHLSRIAYIYIRQSTEHQVRENIESQERQYELFDLALQYQWKEESIIIIDDDQGTSASTSGQRDGFAKLAANVALGKAGIIFGLDVSRLARNNRDWYQLLDLCSLTNTLIGDFDGIYDPSCFNDRLLLGLKGTISEAEIHVLKGRMLEGLYHKAQKGELRFRLPVGYQHDEDGKIIKSQDEQVTHMIDLMFKKFFEIGSTTGVAKYFAENNLLFPRQAFSENKVRWIRPYQKAIRDTLGNPLYTGAYVFGRTKQVKELDEKGNQITRKKFLPMEEWRVNIKDNHPAYVSWEEYLEIQERIERNRNVAKFEVSQVVREGSALLQGLARCSKCGRSMYVIYRGQRSGSNYPYYICNVTHNYFGGGYCQSIGGRRVDRFVEETFLEMVSPASLNIHLKVLENIEQQEDMTLKQLELQLEKAEYEADRAFRQFDAVEPENRLVARTLERQWNEALRVAGELELQIKEQKINLEKPLLRMEMDRAVQLAHDLPTLWDAITYKERKRLLRTAIEEVQLKKEDRDVTVKIIWIGGAMTENIVHLPKIGNRKVTHPDIIELVRELAKKFTDVQISRILHRQGHKTPTGLNYSSHKVANLRRSNDIARYQKPKDEQPKTYNVEQTSEILQVSRGTVYRWLNAGYIRGEQVTMGAPWEIILTDEEIGRLTAQETPSGWVALNQAAKELGVSKQTVLSWIKAKKLEYIYVSKGRKKGLRINTKSAACGKQATLFN
jgi:DNA invertase Pin-like site-specific DNA recombinase